MNNVFQIDQECFLIYLEEFASLHNAFIKIGNSSALNNFKDQLRYVTLISSLNPGNPVYELELLRNQKDIVIIGLKKELDNYKKFIISNGIDEKKIQCIYVEEANEVKNQDKSEKHFIEIIKNDNKLKYHSFASFYNDGNIRVFNKREIFFDLLEKLNQNKSIKYEINQSKEIYKNFYLDSYKKDGLINCENSFFIFSNDKFACIANDSRWIKDAIRVGIDPINIDYLFLNTNLKPDISWFKIFSDKAKNKSVMNIVIQSNDTTNEWIKLFPKEYIKPVFSNDELNKTELNNIKLLYKNEIINIIFGKYKFFISINNNSKKEQILGNINDHKFKITIDDFDHESYTLFSKNPLIFNDNLNNLNYIKTFWDTIQVKSKEKFASEIKGNDQEYKNDYKPGIDENDEKDFYQQLFLETVRRINADGNAECDEKIFKYYKNSLKQFNGDIINNNQILIEQHIGLNKKAKKIIIRDLIANKNFINVKDEINPLLKFQNEHEISEWNEKLNDYRNNHKKNIINKSIDAKIIKRFNDIIESKKFHKLEQDRLSRFIQEKKINDKRKENIENKEEINQIYNTNNQFTTVKEQEELIKVQGDDVKKTIKKKNKIKIPLLPILIIIFILFLLLGAGYLAYKNIKNLPPEISKIIDNFKNKSSSSLSLSSDSSSLSQNEYFSSKSKDNSSISSNITSKYYKFSMTIDDLINLVNEIAIKNGYHRMAPDYLKENLKGKDPDWIYPDNKFKMPDDSEITVVNGDTLWGICEKYLVNEINKHEIIIRDLILKTKTKEVSVDDAKKQFTKIKNETHSEMMRDIISVLVTLPNYNEWEPYLDEKAK